MAVSPQSKLFGSRDVYYECSVGCRRVRVGSGSTFTSKGILGDEGSSLFSKELIAPPFWLLPSSLLLPTLEPTSTNVKVHLLHLCLTCVVVTISSTWPTSLPFLWTVVLTFSSLSPSLLPSRHWPSHHWHIIVGRQWCHSGVIGQHCFRPNFLGVWRKVEPLTTVSGLISQNTLFLESVFKVGVV